MSPDRVARRAVGLAAGAAAAAIAALLRHRSGRAPRSPAAAPQAPTEPPPTVPSAVPSAMPAEAAPAAAPAPEPAQAVGVEPPAGPLDMNEATFEQLRGIGLSITQARRFLAERERRGGFDSLDDLDDVVGLSRDLRAQLRKQLRV